MLGIKVNLKDAEKIKNFLIEKELLKKNFIPEKENNFIYFPIKEEVKAKEIFDDAIIKKKLNLSFYEFVDIDFKESKKFTDYKDLLSFSEEKKKNLPSSFDIIGDIIIIELGGFTKNEETEIAKALLKTNKNIKTILKKAGFFEGEFRTRRLEFIYGENKKETIHKENNVKIKLDVEKVYFSPRLSTERKRIVELINKKNKKETILVMFSGSGVYPIVLSKKTNAKLIIGIEKNKIAHKYAIENLNLNKIKNVELICGDVRKEVPKLKEKEIFFDRILMPLPKGAENFLDFSFIVSKKGTIIHFYDFEHESEFNKAIEKINIAAKGKIKYKILNLVKCGQYSPEKYRICVDFEILEKF